VLLQAALKSLLKSNGRDCAINWLAQSRYKKIVAARYMIAQKSCVLKCRGGMTT
jgi:hypothetical protein